MAEVKSVEELLQQIAAFEKTISGLSDNVAKLKEKLRVNQEKFGSDISKWPTEEK